ncbi:hypothetical protein SDRG_05856 [Saprolegnia diclina VS20]|uniref:RGS domain-containing protein n=1 Tax=Saprolegnia diclina (strain VS20) TaxID=1156394 RepID=T0RV60_SAPDV|nr:hypothetical protein SDRG_05856 [Saprolegnia diclina VS20]EQC36398.1 hypothetical protein SDRG_05856 [Saprolegnia diclina VS20]|eukprot:XP_008609819.1 hypothetical protein SDRG_05856 [Saprolegnia diclina VS20]
MATGPVLYAALLGLSGYMPLAILVYLRRRGYPSIRFGNPVQTALCSSLATLVSIGMLVLLLLRDSISCAVLVGFEYFSVNATLIALLVTELSIVLTFELTEEIADHHDYSTESATKLSQQRIKVLRAMLSLRGLGLLWGVAHILWLGLPIAIVGPEALASLPSPNATVTDCFAPVGGDVSPLAIVSFVHASLFIATYALLSYFLARVMDNFGLCFRYRLMGGLLALVFLGYAVCVALEANADLQAVGARYILLSLGGHAVVLAQIVFPIFASRSERIYEDGAMVLHTTKMNLLETYLETAEGYRAFAEFARIQFSYENAVAWKACADFKKGGGDSHAIYNTYIKAQSVLETNIPGTLRKYYFDIFEKSRKGHKVLGYHTALDKDFGVFDKFRDAILKLMVLDTLPRFQNHALGKGWSPFVETQESHFVLNHLMDAIEQPKNLVVPFDGQVQTVVDRVRRVSSSPSGKARKEFLPDRRES